MFRVIHPNRWLIWTLAILIVMSLGTMWFISQTIQELERHASQLVGSAPVPWRTFRSEALGLSVKYPGLWQIEVDRDDAQTVHLENSQNYNENITISVRDPKFEALIREALDIGEEQEVVVDGKAGKMLANFDSKDRAASKVVLLETDGKLYYIAGFAKDFEKIVGSIKFLPAKFK